MELADRLLSNARETERGLYVPLVSNVASRGKLSEFDRVPATLTASEGTPLCYFCNALLLPDSRPADFGSDAVKPHLRVTNAGFQVITIEHDPDTVEGLEESINWTSSEGKIHIIDKELRRYRDYNGYCAVWSGHRSVHFHFIFDTKHLKEASFEQSATERWTAYIEQGALMEGVYATYYAKVASLCTEVLCPIVPADKAMRTSHQFRRMPWGHRVLQVDSSLLKLTAGTVIPQLVLCENIRWRRSAKGSQEYLVAPDIRFQIRSPSTRVPATAGSARLEVGTEVTDELVEMCKMEWGEEFPKPISMWWDRHEWVFKFQNHPNDKTPSTVCRGNHNRLLIQGRGVFDDTFILPGELTANELGMHLALRFGLLRHRTPADGSVRKIHLKGFALHKTRRGKPVKESLCLALVLEPLR